MSAPINMSIVLVDSLFHMSSRWRGCSLQNIHLWVGGRGSKDIGKSRRCFSNISNRQTHHLKVDVSSVLG